MFWDRVAGVYDVFVNVINRRTHQELKKIVSSLIGPDDTVLECACGTGLLSAVIAPKCRQMTATDFKRQFTLDSYKQFFRDAEYPDVQIKLAEGRIPCAVAVMKKRQDESI
jgi:ubiquinone/menaquinone biosynthesis C-methylase UbiE